MRYKIFLPVLAGLAGMAVIYREITLRALEDERAVSGLEMAQTVGDSLRDELGTLIRFRLEELNRLAYDIGKNGERNLLQRTTLDFRSDVANITLFRPRPDGTYSMLFETNWELLKEKELPLNAVYLMDKASPLDITAIARKRETGMINRSFLTENGPVGVLSFVLYAKTLDGKPEGPILVADLLAENTGKKLHRSDSVESFVVTTTGALLAHSDPALMVEYRNRPFPGFPTAELPENWMDGSRFTWKQDGEDRLAMITPTALPGVFLSAQVRRQSVTRMTQDLATQAWLAVAALAGVLMVVSFWLSAGLTRNAMNITATLQAMAKGKLESVPRIHTRDEFRYVRDAFRDLALSWKTIGNEEFERGFKESQLATIQTLRASMGNPVTGSFENWELATHRPTVATSHHEFWDFHTVGNRRQVILGRANADGISGILLSLMVRVTLNNVRRLSDRFSAQRPPTLSEILDLVNGAVFTAFKGRVALLASAFEIDLDSGKVTWVHAGGPGAIRWKSETGTIVLDEKTFAGQGAALGAQAISAFQSAQVFLAPGERLFVHAPLLQTQNATGEMALNQIRKAIGSEGGKPLSEVKEAVVKSLDARIFAESLVFVSVRRPTVDEVSATITRAAA